MRAHECGTCGSHQFRVLIDRRPEAGPARSARPALSEALLSAKPFDRSTAVFSLDMQSAEARSVMPRLLEMVSRDPEPMVRLAVVEALRRGVVKVGGTQVGGTEASGTEASGTEASGTEASGTEASRVEASEAVPVLTRALADGYAEVRRAAALTLGSLGPAAGVASAALTRSLSDGNPRVREAAAKALQTIQSSAGAHAQESPPRDTPSLHA